MVTDK